MGINASAIRVFLIESERRRLKGSVLQLGRQDIFVKERECRRIFSEYGRDIETSRDTPILSQKPDLARDGFLSDEFLFSALGFSENKAMDASPYEGADYLLDMNVAETPEEHRERWDVIFDGGLVEHVFNVPNALAHIGRMLKVGGRIVHIQVSSNHIDHGFYMFSPTLFWDYYTANGYEINVCQVFRYHRDSMYDGKWAVSDYIPGGLSRVSMGGLDNGMYGIILIATKKPHSTFDVVPQQGKYANVMWQGNVPDKELPGLDMTFKGDGLGLKVAYKV